MNEKVIWDTLKAAGLTDAGAAGLMGNLYAESGMEPAKVEALCLKRLKQYNIGDYTDASYTAAVDSGAISREQFLQPIPGKHYGYGIAQWTTEDRKAALYDFMKCRGVSIGDLKWQLDFLVEELKTSYSGVWRVLTTSESYTACSDVALMRYEAPENWSQYTEIRRGYSCLIYERRGQSQEEPSEPGFDREKVISIARAEAGYLEKSKSFYQRTGAAGLYDKTAGAGSDNYTKYGYEMHRLYPQVMDFPAPWCDAYVDWCFMQAYGVTNAKKLIGGRFDDYTVASAQLYKDKKAWKPAGTIPERGWQIFFKNNSRICHTGLVVDVVKKDGAWYIITVEGNTSSEEGVVANGGCVRIKQYRVDYSRIAGYGVPPYGDATKAEKVAFTPHWVKDGDNWFYRIAHGQNAHGWQVINGHWYFFDEKGKMLTGTQNLSGKWYLLATKALSQEFEGACMITDDKGALKVMDV